MSNEQQAFTPGPWSRDNPSVAGHYIGLEELGDIRGWNIRAGGKTICSQVSNSLDHSEALANARLIAAAPEMLIALQYAEACLEGVGGIAGSPIALRKVRAALAKATQP